MILFLEIPPPIRGDNGQSGPTGERGDKGDQVIIQPTHAAITPDTLHQMKRKTNFRFKEKVRKIVKKMLDSENNKRLNVHRIK